ncbi:MAG TPA: hypothetical protein VNB94_05305 [Mycobacteriales bacterium]|nr:hypothetical protein [Mycobacteriales bacterium]
MSRRGVVQWSALAAVGMLLAVPAGAAPKTIEKSFAVAIPVPLLGSTGSISVACNDGGHVVPGTTHREAFAAPGAGTLVVEVTGFVGDWDLALDVAGKRLAEGSGTVTPTSMSDGSLVEKLKFKVKKAGKVEIVVCNFAGGPSGKGKYVFTVGK